MSKPRPLVDPGAYTRCPSGYWRRLPFVYTAVTLVALVAVATALWPLYPLAEAYLTGHPEVSLILIVAGLLAYFLFFRPWMRRDQSSPAPDPVLARPPSVPAQASWYLAVLQYTNDGRFLPGMLSVVPQGLSFQPLEDPHASPLLLVPRDKLEFSATTPRLRFTDRLFFARTPELLRIASPSSAAVFLLPEPSVTVPALRAALEDT